MARIPTPPRPAQPLLARRADAQSKAYPTSAYYVAKLLAALPFNIVTALSFVLTIYGMVRAWPGASTAMHGSPRRRVCRAAMMQRASCQCVRGSSAGGQQACQPAGRRQLGPDAEPPLPTMHAAALPAAGRHAQGGDGGAADQRHRHPDVAHIAAGGGPASCALHAAPMSPDTCAVIYLFVARHIHPA